MADWVEHSSPVNLELSESGRFWGRKRKILPYREVEQKVIPSMTSYRGHLWNKGLIYKVKCRLECCGIATPRVANVLSGPFYL